MATAPQDEWHASQAVCTEMISAARDLQWCLTDERTRLAWRLLLLGSMGCPTRPAASSKLMASCMLGLPICPASCPSAPPGTHWEACLFRLACTTDVSMNMAYKHHSRVRPL